MAAIPAPTARQPIILLGMHRSGTSLLSALLEQLGLFVGADLQPDHESIYFMKLNDELFSNVSAAWDHPTPMRDFFAHPDAVEMTAKALAAELTSNSVATFFGKQIPARQRTFAGFDRPWGFKDPRTIFSLPLWLKLFPGAKLIYLVRNATDVAASLMTREKQRLKKQQERFDERMTRRDKRSRLELAAYRGSPRCLSPEGGFSLWEEYVEEAERQLAAASNARLCLRYEDLIADSQAHLDSLIQFCQLAVLTPEARQRATAMINPDRAESFRADPALAAFHEKIRPSRWMAHYGY